MIIETAQLGSGAKQFTGEEPAFALELESDEFVQAESLIQYDLQARLVSVELLVQGTLEVDLSCLCSRCAERFSNTVRVQDFSRSYKLASENESIDLTNDVREDILLNFPMNWVCSSSCQGLCPQCGANLNKQTCSCWREESNATWSSLNQLNLTE